MNSVLAIAMFSGSYRQEDVQILLKPISIMPVSIMEKEQFIQSGQRHYSEMISQENLPSVKYLKIFQDALQRNQQRLAQDCLRLAILISASRSGPIALVSLARAGTPVGVILKHILESRLGRTVRHYSVSIIRDHGLDMNAMTHILARERDDSIVFVDGWIAKGVIARELETSVNLLNQQQGCVISPTLYVLSDLAGTSAVAASCDDYLIPSSILNSTISGLISRSILNKQYIAADDFHGCLYYREFEAHDMSVRFVEQILTLVNEVNTECYYCDSDIEYDKSERYALSKSFVRELMMRYNIHDENYVKPGIGEATRVLLRRVPDKLLLRNKRDADVQHLSLLAQEKQVPVIEDSTLPYRAVSLIGRVSHD